MRHVNATLAHPLWSPSGSRDQLSDSWRSLAEIHLRIWVEHTAYGDVPIGIRATSSRRVRNPSRSGSCNVRCCATGSPSVIMIVWPAKGDARAP